ncbi:MAG: DJ-1/PfpI family protein [Cyclobacteriaceae bacterium]|nr:DJ-1/PfpI family protein [Cyclobacteriaceae bacterium]
MLKIAFIVPPYVELLDLAGPAQVFTEAKLHGLDAVIEFYSYHDRNISTSGVGFGEIKNYKESNLNAGDFVFVPGTDHSYLQSTQFVSESDFFKWLAQCANKSVNTCSVCTGAFFLGEAGLLDDRECTTHWRRTAELKARFPKANVLADTLYVKSDNIYTSAGVSAGIDLALASLENLKGPNFVHKVARGLVVYHRRDPSHSQKSIYLDFRNHINPKIHEVQDYLINNLAKENSIESLAEMVAMSPRNLSRVFKDSTGLTIVEYLTELRRETAKTLLNNPDYTLDYIASQCGFKTARQLQRILKS